MKRGDLKVEGCWRHDGTLSKGPSDVWNVRLGLSCWL